MSFLKQLFQLIQIFESHSDVAKVYWLNHDHFLLQLPFTIANISTQERKLRLARHFVGSLRKSVFVALGSSDGAAGGCWVGKCLEFDFTPNESSNTHWQMHVSFKAREYRKKKKKNIVFACIGQFWAFGLFGFS